MNSSANILQRKRYARIQSRLVFIRLGLSLITLTSFFLLSPYSFFIQSSPTAWLDILRTVCLVWLALLIIHFPLKFLSSFQIEHAFGLSNETWKDWLKRMVKTECISFFFFLLMYTVPLLLRLIDPRQWWMTSIALCLVSIILLGRLIPQWIFPILYKTQPLNNPILSNWLQSICQEIQIHSLKLMIFNLGKQTRKANAAVMGLGKSQRMILSDTLIEHFTNDEIKSVIAHELGHHKHRDLLLQLMLASVGIGITLFASHVLLDRVLMKEGEGLVLSAQVTIFI
jgi:STE24 endopeptidase